MLKEYSKYIHIIYIEYSKYIYSNNLRGTPFVVVAQTASSLETLPYNIKLWGRKVCWGVTRWRRRPSSGNSQYSYPSSPASAAWPPPRPPAPFSASAQAPPPSRSSSLQTCILGRMPGLIGALFKTPIPLESCPLSSTLRIQVHCIPYLKLDWNIPEI